MVKTATPKGVSVAPSEPARSRRRRGRGEPGRLEVARFGCDAVAEVEPQALGLTYWFDADGESEGCAVSIRFTGRRSGVKGKPGRGDTFDVVEKLGLVVPGSGPIAVTTRVPDVTPGEWHVTATATTEGRGGVSGGRRAASTRRPPSATSSGVTAYAPVVRVLAPGAHLGAWPALVTVGVVVALSVQQIVARHAGLPALRLLALSVLASIVGAAGAKVYYLVEHRDQRPSLLTAGMCIQGFVLGAVGALAVGTLVLDVPVGRALDVSTPGLLFGMTIGRFGCFFGGCCAGRPTGSRWGLWSSDRRLGARRVPTQLLESALAFVSGAIALVTVWSSDGDPGGVVFIGAVAAYTLGRQLLFPLRDLPRNTSHGRAITMTLAAIAVVAAVVAGIAV